VSVAKLLEAICLQVGAVYDYLGGMPGRPARWTLREGDWDADPRPRGTAGDMYVYLEQIRLQRTRASQFTWGEPEPAMTDSTSLTIGLRVEPPSLGLLPRVAGVHVTEAVLDTGASVRNPDAPQMDGRMIVMRTGSAFTDLPAPPEDAETITELRGVVIVHARLDHVRIEFGPADTGGERPFATGQCRLTSWAPDNGKLTISIRRPQPPEQPVSSGMTRATLHGPDGQTVSQRSDSLTEVADGMATEGFIFTALDFDPVKVVLEADVVSGPLEQTPFVIENIPLP